MSQHSGLVGGSTAGRLMACPGSWGATAALPATTADTESEYAAEGTAMHAVMAALLDYRRRTGGTVLALRELAQSWIGAPFYDRVLTQAHLDTMILIALDDLAGLEAEYGGGFAVVDIEAKVRFPGVPGAFGTCDLLLQNDRTLLVVDWKFGAGVPVGVITGDPASGEYLNPQLAYYAAAALHSRKKLFSNRTIAVAIVQPRALTTLSHTTVTRRELRQFREDLEQAVVEALAPHPPRFRGEHCRFAPCKLSCPLWTGPLLDLSTLGVVSPQPDDVAAPVVTPFGQYLAAAKVLCDQLTILKNEIDGQLHNFLAAGGLVPGWRLKNKVKRRQWADPSVVEPALLALGFQIEEIYQYPPLATFQSADAVARRLGQKIPDDLRVAPLTDETTVCRADDPAPPIDPDRVINQFRAALAAVQDAAAPGSGAVIEHNQET
jgi:hypothetical protein